MFYRRKKNLLWLLLLVAIAVGVGTAFTEANTFAAHAGNQLGYGVQTVSGANVTSMHYTLSADATSVATVTFIAAGDLTQGVPQEHGYVSFTTSGGVGNKIDCGTGTYDTNTTSTTFTCNVSSLNQTVAAVTGTDIAIAN